MYFNLADNILHAAIFSAVGEILGGLLSVYIIESKDFDIKTTSLEKLTIIVIYLFRV